ncbi:MAG: hypothetical protein DI571_00250 [Arsenicicoccus sp.]|nr:MAG: hypothetical protein DI571_00250 [Arsenicicoccus sp.]
MSQRPSTPLIRSARARTRPSRWTTAAISHTPSAGWHSRRARTRGGWARCGPRRRASWARRATRSRTSGAIHRESWSTGRVPA